MLSALRSISLRWTALLVAGVASVCVLASCGTDPESTDSVAASVTSTEPADAALASTGGSVGPNGPSSPELPVAPAGLVTEPHRLCLRPGASGAFTLSNISEQQQQYSSHNAWMFDDARQVMYSPRLSPGDPLIEGPLEFSTETTMLPIAPTPLAPGETVSLGVMSPTEPGEYTLEMDGPVVVALTVDPNCPAEPTLPILGEWTVGSVLLGQGAEGAWTLTSAAITIESDRILIDGPCTDGAATAVLDGQRLTVTGVDFVPGACDEQGTQIQAALLDVFFDVAGDDVVFDVVTTLGGMRLEPVIEPEPDDFRPVGLRLVPSA